jgi:hypothetical protein
MNEQAPVKIRAITPRIFELIGEIAIRAVELEFVLAFCVKTADKEGKIKIEESMSVRRKLIGEAEKIFAELDASGVVANLPNTSKLMEQIQEVLEKRNSVVHGLLMRKDDEGLKLFQFRGEKWVDIDEGSLQSILNQIQQISDETLELRTKIWQNLNFKGLLQLGLDSPAYRGDGTVLT